MLEVFRRAGVTNAVCVVTRYFGGVLLGTGGLLRAYTAAAADALSDAGISEVRRWLACEVSTPYALYEPVRAAVAALGGVVQETQYAAAVTVCALLPEEAGEAFAAQVRDLTAGRCAVRPVGETERAVPSPVPACERRVRQYICAPHGEEHKVSQSPSQLGGLFVPLRTFSSLPLDSANDRWFQEICATGSLRGQGPPRIKFLHCLWQCLPLQRN